MEKLKNTKYFFHLSGLCAIDSQLSTQFLCDTSKQTMIKTSIKTSRNSFRLDPIQREKIN